MQATILQTLKDIEQTHDIKIIYAVESGSRAWGFASPDSDYDVRYIYIRRAEDYLRVDTIRDTIEGPLDEILDFSGWDLRKMLELLRRSNPSLMEWYQSPIVYLTTDLWETLAQRIPEFFQVKSNMHHYLSMCYNDWNRNFQSAPDGVKAKRYLYVLRALLCCRWLERHGTVPPVPFARLREAVLPPELAGVMADLLERKKQALETDLVPRIPELDAFITEELPRLTQVRDNLPQQPLPDYDGVNDLFRRLLNAAWS